MDRTTIVKGMVQWSPNGKQPPAGKFCTDRDEIVKTENNNASAFMFMAYSTGGHRGHGSLQCCLTVGNNRIQEDVVLKDIYAQVPKTLGSNPFWIKNDPELKVLAIKLCTL